MAVFAQPLIVALLLWWVSTGAILWLVRRPEKTFGRSLAISAAVAGAACVGLFLSARDGSATGAYVAFGCALTVWGWHEMGFLMGKVTGPRRDPRPLDATGWRRFVVSCQTVIHHEIALALTAVLIVGLTWSQPNQTGALTFLLLFGMRLSTKLNIFLGVPNPPVAFVPAHLVYLKTYFRRARFNALIPISLALSVCVVVMLAQAALNASGGTATSYALMFGLAALGLLEHGFLMMPSPDRALWGWALGPPKVPAKPALAATGEREP
jgi:putative photosynthetic complex assembly protein 2